MIKIFENLEKYLLYLLVVLFPIFVLPIFSSPYVISKEVLLVVFSVLVLLVWLVKSILSGKAVFSVGKFDLGMILLVVAYIASTILKSPNKMDALLLPGTTTIIVSSALLYFLLNQLNKKSKEGLSFAVLFSSVLLGLSILFTETGILGKIPQLPAFIKDANFNALGGFLPSIIYLVVSFIFSVSLIFKQNDLVKKLFVGVSLVIVIFGILVSVRNILPGKPQAMLFPSYQTSWVIAVEALKESPVLGIGPSNYLSAFNRFRPLSYNQTSLWQNRFTTASNYYLTVLTETGFFGIFAFLILILAVYKKMSKNINLTNYPDVLEKVSLVVLLVAFAFLPTVSFLVTLLFVILSTMSDSEENTIVLSNTSSKAPVILMSLPFFAAIIAVGFFGTKIVMAEVTYQKSIVALSKNDAKSTYDLMAKAINQNQNVDRYHSSLAQINMALASSLASKKDLTADDKKTITQLVQQAINEGKSAVILNPQKSDNWDLLAGIYRNIMPFAQGSDQFAIQTYSQAVTLDPTNPTLRIALGGVYYALGKYDNAIDTFKLAVLSKSNLANAHYNLAVAYREKKDFDNAIAEMNTVLTLVNKDSADYKLAQTTLEDLQTASAKASASKEKQGETLTTPQSSQKSSITPPITLPENANPPTNQ